MHHVDKPPAAAHEGRVWTRNGGWNCKRFDMLSAGTPLKEIADVLRHRSLDTSAIYTKVDTTRLMAVALPWPGSAAA